MKERCFPDWDEICTKLDLNAHLPKPPPEAAKEGKEGDAEKKTEQDNGDTDKTEKELEKDKVCVANSNFRIIIHIFTLVWFLFILQADEPKEKIEENKEKEEAAK